MLRIVGDINLTDGYFDTGFGTGSKVKQGMDPFAHLVREKGDYWIGNMECVCASTSNQCGLKQKQFIIAPQYLNHINHLDFYGVANNHVMQHGEDAYAEMLGYLDSKSIAYAGSISKHSYQFTHQGKVIGIMVFSLRPDNFTKDPCYWSMPELEEMEAELHKLAGCDYRILYVHWGNEFIDYPYIDQKQLAHFLVDHGIHLIIGMHPHRLQGCEQYKGSTIFYSLGNFVFNMPWEPTKYSIIVNVDLSETTPVITYDYVAIGKDYCPRYTKDVPQAYRMEHLNELLNINEENEKYYHRVFHYNKQYQRVNRTNILKNIARMKPSDSLGMISDFIKRKI